MKPWVGSARKCRFGSRREKSTNSSGFAYCMARWELVFANDPPESVRCQFPRPGSFSFDRRSHLRRHEAQAHRISRTYASMNLWRPFLYLPRYSCSLRILTTFGIYDLQTIHSPIITFASYVLSVRTKHKSNESRTGKETPTAAPSLGRRASAVG